MTILNSPVETAPQVDERGESEGLGSSEDDVTVVALGLGRPLSEILQLRFEGLRIHVLVWAVLGREGVDGGDEEDELGRHAKGVGYHCLRLAVGHGFEPGGGLQRLGQRSALKRVGCLSSACKHELGAHEESWL